MSSTTGSSKTSTLFPTARTLVTTQHLLHTASTPATWVTSNAHWFFVDDVANAGDAMKFTVLQTDVHSGSGSTHKGTTTDK